MDVLEKAKIRLIKQMPFFASLFNQCVIKYDNERVPTAGVGVLKSGQIIMVFNEDYLNSLSTDHQIGLIQHELLHLCMDHITRAEHLPQKKIANLAQDVAINQYIDDKLLPKGALTPEQFKLPKDKAFEFYYGQLIKQQEKTEGAKTLDEHGNVGDEDGEGGKPTSGDVSKSFREKVIDNMMQKADNETKQRSRGTMPAPIEKRLEELSTEQAANWRQALRSYIGRQLAPERESTRCKPNRRMGFMAQGKKSEYMPKIIVAVDQSGSVDDNMNAEFMKEIKEICKNSKDRIEVAFFDTQVSKTMMLDEYKTVTERYACGGTDFNAPIIYANSKKPDLLIMLTDGGAPLPDETPRYPVIYAVPHHCHSDHLEGGGKIVKLNLEE